MPSKVPTNNQHDSPRCLNSSSENSDIEGGRHFYRAERSKISFQYTSTWGSNCAINAELGGIKLSFLSVCCDNRGISGTENHDVPKQLQQISVNVTSFADSFRSGLAERHPFRLILVRTLQAALWSFGPLGWLKVIIPSFPMSQVCTVAGILVGVVFLKHLTAYLLSKLKHTSGSKTVRDWLQSHPRYRHFLSFSRSPFDLGETPEADEAERQFGLRFRQERYAALLDEGWLRKVFEFLTYPFKTFRDLYSLPVILFRTVRLWGCLFIVQALASYLAPEWNPDFPSAGMITGITFLKQVLAYLRPKFPRLWVDLIHLIDAVMIFRTVNTDILWQVIRAFEYTYYS